MSATQLAYLSELVARDEAASREFAELERQLANVAELRARADWARRELELGPAEVDAAAADAARAEQQLSEARERLEAAIRDESAARNADASELREAELLVVETRDTVHIVERRASDAQATLQERRAQLSQAEAESPEIELRAAELASSLAIPRLPSTVSIAPAGLAQIREWSIEARAALVVARSTVAGEREQAIRQASELGALVTGSALPASSMTTLAGAVRSALAP